MTLFRLAAACLLAATLSACQSTDALNFSELKPEQVRPGLTAAQAETLRRPPNGLRKIWAYDDAEFEQLDPQLDLRVHRSGDGFRWTGNLKVKLPGTNIREIARQIEEATGRKAPVSGNYALVPVEMRSDRRGRLTGFQFLGDNVIYAPHDCQNTLGSCKSTWSDGSGTSRKVIVETSESDGRWYAVVRLDPAHNFGNRRVIEQRVYSIDRYGLLRDAAIVDREDDAAPYFLRER